MWSCYPILFVLSSVYSVYSVVSLLEATMAKKQAESEPVENGKVNRDVLREPAEVCYADQLEALRQNDPDTPPKPWRLSPRAVLTYVTEIGRASCRERG